MDSMELNHAEFQSLIRGLTKAQRYHVKRGCISGDFTMNTVNALKRKGLFHLVISSPNGQCGFMELTVLGEHAQAYLKQRHLK